MVGGTLGHYRIAQKLGEGGMGVVYRAHDEQLDRDVAIKVLPATSVQDDVAHARLLREARAAAALNHPNICTIYEVGEAAGRSYIAMELVKGQPLSEKLAAGALPASEVTRCGLQLADALAHAHDHHLIHRDLKSANIIITPEGRAKILDFGLAKRTAGEEFSEAATVSGLSLTQPGSVVGTLAYMPPEQLRGQPADARSDIWALGVVLHEMASAGRPFHGHTAFELSSAILNQPPGPLPPAVPPEVQAVIERCLEKEPARRYQTAGEVRAALEAVVSGTARVPVAPRPRLPWRALLGGLLALLVVLGALGLFVAVKGGAWRQRLLPQVAPAGGRLVLAVLPFENLSGDAEQEYFSDGLTEEMTSQIRRVQPAHLAVIARTSVIRYKKTTLSTEQIGRELKAEYLLKGTVRREGNRVRIGVELIAVRDEVPLWSDSFDRDLASILTLQSEVGQRVAQALALKLLPAEQAALASTRSVNPEAYDAYLRGSYLFRKLSRENLIMAAQEFQRALDKDPDYAPAYAGLAGVWLSLSDAGHMPLDQTAPKWKAAVDKGLELDPSLAEAHTALATFKLLYERDYTGAEKEFQRAIQLDAGNWHAHFGYADFLISLKRTAEWQPEIQRAMELDPASSFTLCFYGWHLVYLGRCDEAIDIFRKILQSEQDFSSAHLGLWGALYKKRMEREALDEAKKFFAVLKDNEVVSALERGGAEGGYRAAMKQAGDTMAARAARSHVPALRVARVYAHSGDNDATMKWLEESYRRHETTLIHLGVGWDWDGLRGDPRFQDLLRRMKLPQ